jgi:hypothetical protein
MMGSSRPALNTLISLFLFYYNSGRNCCQKKTTVIILRSFSHWKFLFHTRLTAGGILATASSSSSFPVVKLLTPMAFVKPSTGIGCPARCSVSVSVSGSGSWSQRLASLSFSFIVLLNCSVQCTASACLLNTSYLASAYHRTGGCEFGAGIF